MARPQKWEHGRPQEIKLFGQFRLCSRPGHDRFHQRLRLSGDPLFAPKGLGPIEKLHGISLSLGHRLPTLPVPSDEPQVREEERTDLPVPIRTNSAVVSPASIISASRCRSGSAGSSTSG